MKFNKPLVLPIKHIIAETPRIKTFVFDYDFPGEPGQFVMTWIPGYDEKPFGIIKKDKVGLITLHRPKALNALCDALINELNDLLAKLDADNSI
ncbi:MAG TPA: enoyl-CoA hydratase-related protein, partial [Candidatus Woesebacteria bacterium]|nr:enoyl-CoA hydratase-related protein [Candidatus Woesebacteria bacterium]